MELNVYRFLFCDERPIDENRGGLYYNKFEVDALIESKDKAFKYSQAVILVDIEIIKKQKRKRCLAMADMCRAEICFCDNYGAKRFDEKYANRKLNHFGKWALYWLSLYYKFK